VSARGGSYLPSGIEDVVFVNLKFPSGILAQIQLSWLDPRKERRLAIVGSQKMVELDDVHPSRSCASTTRASIVRRRSPNTPSSSRSAAATS
jgi:predicted dehydrogenase